jgi:hypothetical protein
VGAALVRVESLSAEARLLDDRGEAASSEEFFRSREFLLAEGVTHSLLVEGGASRVAAPLIVREIPGGDGARDASSPYSYPGAEVTGPALDPGRVDWRASGLVSVFLRDRLGEPAAFAGGTERSIVLVSDPARPRKSRMSDRQQIRKNEAAGYRVERVAGPESEAGQREALHSVYSETMSAVGAGERYLFGLDYFERLLGSARSELFLVRGPEGDVAAAAITVISDGFLHYYLSGTAAAHRRRAPSKNLIVAVTDRAEELGMPMNLGGGVRPGDGLEEFKRGFANRELPFRTHEIVCDRALYDRLVAGRSDEGFFPLYRSPRTGPGPG